MPLSQLSWPVTTARLSIRPSTTADAGAIFDYRTLEPVAEWMTARPLDRAAWIGDFEERRLSSTLVLEREGRPVGDLFLKVEDAWAQAELAERAKDVQAEIGWCLDPAHQGRGYAGEAVVALLAIAFDGLGLRRVTANCFADNVPSWRIMERVGMRRESYNLRDSLHRSGRWLDGMSYALLAEEWRAARVSPAGP